MKQIIFTTFLIIFCVSLFAQTIITKSGLHIKAYYGYTMSDRLKYPSVLKNNRDYILYSEIDTITGDINPSLQDDIMKFNNSVVFINDLSQSIIKPVEPVYTISSDRFHNSNTSGDYLISAGENYLYGVGLGIGGGVITYIGVSNTNLEELVFIGAGMVLTGFVCTIVGHTKLINAGKMMNKNKVLSLQPSKSGVGLALVF